MVIVALAAVGCGEDRATSPTGGSGGASDVQVAIEGFEFVPPEIEVESGASVTWTNSDDSAHPIQDEGGLFPESEDLGAGDSFSFTSDAPGQYPYICGIHPFMKGTVSVS